MANLKEVKTRISSVTSTQQITKAMKMVAAAKMRRAQDRIIQMRPYSKKLSAILANVSAGTVDDSIESPYTVEREIENILIVAITSDKGLCGAFNSNVFKAATAHINENYKSLWEQGKVAVMTIGKKSDDHFKRKGFNVVDNYADSFKNLSFDTVREAAEYAMTSFQEKKYDRVDIVYNEFKNVATQILNTEQFLPLEKVEKEEGDSRNIDYIYEPDQKYIVEELIPTSLKIQLYKAVLESNASEHGARMTAMDKATENAGDLLKELRLTYNRTRQAAITKEILEIVGGAEALASS